MTTNDSAGVVNAVRASGNFFGMIGARMQLGRPFNERDVAAQSPVVVISNRLWRSTFGADSTLAAPLRTASRQYTIIGVLADGQEFPANVDVWFPASFGTPDEGARVNINWIGIGRLRPRATVASASAELSIIARRIRASDPGAIYDFGATLVRLDEHLVGAIALYLTMLMGVVLIVLLIVCANVAAAGLARGAARSREMAVRASLGAGRGRLVSQILIEHAWLGLVACVAGLFVAWALTHAIVARWGAAIPRANEVAIDGRVFAFAAAAAIGSSLVAGLIPALRITGRSLRDMLASGGRTAAKGGRTLAGASLVGAEIALAVLLLTGAGLLIRSFRAVLSRDLGVDTNVVTAQALLGGVNYARDPERRLAYWDALLEQTRAIPGVRAVGVTNFIPLDMSGQGFVDVEGRDFGAIGAVYRTVNDGFFEALGMHLERGRLFGPEDEQATDRVVVVNREMAKKYWPNENPIGRRVRARSMEASPEGAAPWLTVIGVVNDIRTYGFETQPRPEMYVLYRQTPRWSTGLALLVRGDRPASQLIPEIRRRARNVDAHVALDVGTLDDRVRRILSTRTLTLALLGGFSAVALLLAALGVYGVLSYAVAQRTRELAVRSALGAQRGQLLGLVFASGLRVAMSGVAAGIVGAVALTRTMESMLVDVTALDPLSFAGAVLALLIVALLAIAIPARRATKLDPVIALQSD